MSDESDFDKDLDELLNEALDDSKPRSKDESIPKGKDPVGSATTSTKRSTDLNSANPSTTSKTAPASSAKTVRFQEDDGYAENDSLLRKQAPSNLMSSLFFDDVKDAKDDGKSGRNKIDTQPQQSQSQPQRPQKKPGDDWLGFGDTDFSLPFSTSGNKKDEKRVDIDKSQPPETGQPKLPRSADIFSGNLNPSPKPVPSTFESEGFTSPVRQPQSQPRPLSSLDSILAKTVIQHDEPIAVDRSNRIRKPSGSASGGVGTTGAGGSTSLVDALPFLFGKPKNQRDTPTPEMVIDRGGSGEMMEERAKPEVGKVVKKRVVTRPVSASANNAAANTLQLPSHLVNEDELKAMSQSLKSLYAHQLELQEQSYQEQLEFYAVQSKRKEELMEMELTRLQQLYDERIQKLQTELMNNNKTPKSMEQELSAISSRLEGLTSDLQGLKDQSYPNTKNLVDQMKMMLQNETENLVGRIERKIETGVGTGNQTSADFQQIIKSFANKLEELLRNQTVSASKQMNENQSHLRNSIVEAVVSSMAKLVEQHYQSSSKKKDKEVAQTRELRKDLRRLYIEMDSKNDLIHRSQVNAELEQRGISQSIRDINTFLKIMNESGFLSRRHDDSSSNHLASIQAAHSNAQNEMELRMLKEERRSLSESIAEMNVERRKLTDEKLSLERERMQFEREINRVRDTEASSKARMAEAEEMKREAENTRLKHTKLIAETESKIDSLNKERTQIHERLHQMEQALLFKEQKLFVERSELMREKEFLEKLREQSLCPSCMKGWKNEGLSTFMSPPNSSRPPPAIPMTRSSGDGVDFDFTKLSSLLTPEEKAYLLQDNPYLQELGRRHNN